MKHIFDQIQYENLTYYFSSNTIKLFLELKHEILEENENYIHYVIKYSNCRSVPTFKHPACVFYNRYISSLSYLPIDWKQLKNIFYIPRSKWWKARNLLFCHVYLLLIHLKWFQLRLHLKAQTLFSSSEQLLHLLLRHIDQK